MNTEKKNLVVVGYGGMGGGFHVKHALESDVVNLLGVCDIDPQKREKARHDGLFVYETLSDVLSDPRCDLVTVAVPNDCHREIVLRALGAGKNVLCEKPVALSSAELTEMISAAEAAKKHFTVHQNRRFDVDFLAMKSLTESGEIGAVRRIESRIQGSRGIPGDWRKEKAHGGGMLYDWGIHLIDQMLCLIPGKVTSLYCRFDHVTTREVDDGFRLTLTFENGAEALIEVGTSNFIAMPRFYMLGGAGSAIITDWREPCQVVKCLHWQEDEVTPVRTAAGLTKTMAPRDEITVSRYELPRPVSDVHDFYRNFCHAIDGKEEQMVTHAEMLRDLRIMEAAFLSAEKDEVLKELSI